MGVATGNLRSRVCLNRCCNELHCGIVLGTLPLLSLAITRFGGELGRNSLKQSQSAIHHHRPRRKRNLQLVIFEIILYLTYVFNEFNSFIVSSSFFAPSVLIIMCESVKACTAKTGVTSFRPQLLKRWITQSTG